MKKILIVGEPHPSTASMMAAFSKIGIDVISIDKANHLSNHIGEAIEINTFDDPIDEGNYIPEPKKGIAQKAQWASKPHKRKR